MDAQELLRQLQIVLSLRVKTGQITFHLRDGHLESFETRTVGRLKKREPANQTVAAQHV